PRELRSFPTRRSSDLTGKADGGFLLLFPAAVIERIVARLTRPCPDAAGCLDRAVRAVEDAGKPGAPEAPRDREGAAVEPAFKLRPADGKTKQAGVISGSKRLFGGREGWRRQHHQHCWKKHQY